MYRRRKAAGIPHFATLAKGIQLRRKRKKEGDEKKLSRVSANSFRQRCIDAQR